MEHELQIRPSAVLFICRMNAVRSPMAEALTKMLFPKQVYVRSCGVFAGERDPFVDAVMDEAGIDMSFHEPKTFEDLAEEGFDLIITLAPEAHHMALDTHRTQAVEVEYWPTIDPTIVTGSREQIMNAYREVRDALQLRLKKRLGWQPAPSG
ncbi:MULTISPECIES: low molecular weight phosphatase family protein [Pseudovibrio]|uniref:arsenate-mycothiol transferase ArsC n=1 Tax=Stappiaceae TaxID=2821832 RepID=UPI0023657CB6|nr:MULTISPECIES: low molecular weight phosphatase family protein [Pseudovibrio]MDD7911085.1 low molecular weight phosphatase family protein [Pseudovibrio exalbescens]MDX5595698.1 low molecular weight phosphatase family protein [Pseudovibrio sp. SPO723]